MFSIYIDVTLIVPYGLSLAGNAGFMIGRRSLASNAILLRSVGLVVAYLDLVELQSPLVIKYLCGRVNWNCA